MENEEKNIPEPLRLKNDLSEELKNRIRQEVSKRLDTLFQQEDFSVNDISQLSGVAHGSVRSRAKTMSSVSEIVTAIFDGTRKNPSGKPTVQSVKSLIESMTTEQRSQFLREIGLQG